jgi:hypothetical protein
MLRLSLLFIAACFLNQYSFAQILSIDVKGDMLFKSKTTHPVKYQIEEYDLGYNRFFEYSDFLQVDYQHFLKKYPFSVLLEYRSMIGFSNFFYDIPQIRNSYKGYGGSRTHLYRSSVGLSYRLRKKNSRLDIEPYCLISFEKSKSTWDGDSISAILQTSNFLPYQGVVTVEPIERIQILPELGIRTNLRLLWRFSLNASASYSFGHKAFQKETFVYTFDGVPQPDAVFYSDGSGFFYSVGIGMELYGNNMYRKNSKQKGFW